MSRSDVIALNGAHAALIERYLELHPAVAAALSSAGAIVVAVAWDDDLTGGLVATVQRALDGAEAAVPATRARPVFVVEALGALPYALARPSLPVRTARGRFAGLVIPGEGGAGFYDTEQRLHGAWAAGLERFALRLIAGLGAPAAHS